MNLKELSSEGKIAYLIIPIMKVLQAAGGQLERSEIKERIADMDDQIAEYAELEKKSKKTGNTYKEFNFKFNFAIKDLYFNGLLTYTDTSPITLTEKGLYLDLDTLDVQKDIIETSKVCWEELSKSNKKNKTVDVTDSEEETQAEEKIKDDFKEVLLAAISKMSPKNLKLFQELYSTVWVLNSQKKVFKSVMTVESTVMDIILMQTISEQQELLSNAKDIM